MHSCARTCSYAHAQVRACVRGRITKRSVTHWPTPCDHTTRHFRQIKSGLRWLTQTGRRYRGDRCRCHSSTHPAMVSNAHTGLQPPCPTHHTYVRHLPHHSHVSTEMCPYVISTHAAGTHIGTDHWQERWREHCREPPGGKEWRSLGSANNGQHGMVPACLPACLPERERERERERLYVRERPS